MRVFVSYTVKDPAITDDSLQKVEARIKAFAKVFIDKIHNKEGGQRRVDFELWKKAITLTSNPEGGGTLSGGGYYGQGQSCTISASANPGYAFEKWTMDGTTFSFLPTYTFDVTGEAEYVANFQAVTNGVVIGDGAGTHDCLPSYSYYCYTLSQQIYTANELNLGACDISNVSFFNAGTSKTRNFTVYMVNTSKTAFDSNTDWITVTEADQVFSGSVILIRIVLTIIQVPN